VRRACYAADRTGHMILQTLYQQCIKNEVAFFDEFQVVDLILEGTTSKGVVAVELATGELHVFAAKAVLFRHRRIRPHVQDHLQCIRQHR
jgi:succinate dehydrogenase / fumarate reductase flavoprotein subunit